MRRAPPCGKLAAMSETTTVVIADDHAVVRSGLRLLLDAEPGLEVVAEAGDVPTAIRMAKAHRPRVLVLDLNMPGGSSLDAITELRASTPETAIVVLTMQDDPAFAREALRNGALGFVLKEAADDELLEAVRLAAEGDTYLNPRLGARLAAQPPQPTGPPDDLTEREVAVLRLIALGHTNTEIAGQLYLSVRTVETHRAHIQQKLAPLHPRRARALRARARHGGPLDRKGGRHARAVARGADLQLAAEQLDALAHPGQPEAAARLLGIEAPAVVGDLDVHRAAGLGHVDRDAARARVLDRVVERLLGDPVQRHLELG